MPKLGYYVRGDHKKCRVCGVDKPVSEFYIYGQSRDGYMHECKPCFQARNREWAKNNPEKRREAARRARQRNPHKARAISREWRRKNMAHDAARAAARRARVKNATPQWANAFILEEAYALARLRSQATGIKWHVDHIVPLTSDVVCGLHCESNIQVIPGRANFAKGNRYWPDMPTEAPHA